MLGRIVLGLLAVVMLTSCASGRRMMRISPFHEGQEKMPDRERINLWPLAYHNHGATSVLWPLVDMDPKGFSIRPLYNKEGADHSILWPLSGWNTLDQEGWALSTYWDGPVHGAFPLYHRNPEGLTYTLLAWWTKQGGRGLFPLLGWGEDYRYFTPFLIGREEGEEDWSMFWLFPLSFWADDVGFVGPFWLAKDDPEGSWNKGGLWPLIRHSDEKSWVFPLYSRKQAANHQRYRLLLGLGGWNDYEEEGWSAAWLAPLWFDRQTPQTREQLLLPFSPSFALCFAEWLVLANFVGRLASNGFRNRPVVPIYV